MTILSDTLHGPFITPTDHSMFTELDTFTEFREVSMNHLWRDLTIGDAYSSGHFKSHAYILIDTSLSKTRREFQTSLVISNVLVNVFDDCYDKLKLYRNIMY